MDEVYARLAKHLEKLLLGYPNTEPLLDLLAASFSPTEAQVVLGVPNDLAPFQGGPGPDRDPALRPGRPDGQRDVGLWPERGLLYTAPLPCIQVKDCDKM